MILLRLLTIAIGTLMAIAAVCAGYQVIGLSLAFGADSTKLTESVLVLSVALSLGLWMAVHHIRVLSRGQD